MAQGRRISMVTALPCGIPGTAWCQVGWHSHRWDLCVCGQGSSTLHPVVRVLLLLLEETWDLGATGGSVLLEDDPVAQLCAPLWPGVLHQLRMVLPFYHFILFYLFRLRRVLVAARGIFSCSMWAS